MQAVIRLLKKLWVVFWGCLATVVLFLPITITALLSSTGNLAFTLSKIWAWTMLRVTCVRVEVRGKEKIRKGQSYIIASNHQSQYDILALVTTLGIQYRWIIKMELRKIPLFGYALYASKNLFIDRSNTESAMRGIREGLQRLPPGASVLFFPEGTRSADGTIGKFKAGAFIMAMEGGLPILPVTVNGSRKVLPKKSFVFSPGKIEVCVAEPIDTKKYTHENLSDLIEKTRDVIISQFNPDYPDAVSPSS